MGEGDLQLFGGDWTEQKLDALGQYLRAYVQVLKKHPFTRVYVDAFAGTGYREQRTKDASGTGTMFGELAEGMFTGPETVVEKRLTFQGLGAFYQERLRTIFPAVADNPRVLLNSRNQPLFQLFFAAANHGRGGQIALRIATHILDRI